MNPDESAYVLRRLQLVRDELNKILTDLDQSRTIDAPDFEGYEYIGYSSDHNPVYRQLGTQKIYERVEGGFAPYVPVYDHTGGLGRVKRD